jgi:hypothetical protein
MSTDAATQSKRKRRLFQRLHDSIPHRAQVISSGSSSISTAPPRATGSNQESTVLLDTQSASQSLSHTDTSASPAQAPAATNTLCTEVVEKALKLLGEPERVIIEGYISSNDTASALEHAFEAAEAKRRVCESKRWTFTVGSHELKLQDEADKVIL